MLLEKKDAEGTKRLLYSGRSLNTDDYENGCGSTSSQCPSGCHQFEEKKTNKHHSTLQSETNWESALSNNDCHSINLMGAFSFSYFG